VFDLSRLTCAHKGLLQQHELLYKLKSYLVLEGSCPLFVTHLQLSSPYMHVNVDNVDSVDITGHAGRLGLARERSDSERRMCI
jgi:hypothetical protein